MPGTLKIPGLLGELDYGIAIQVKDYEGSFSSHPIEQVSKADAYWANENLKIIDRYVIVTKATKDDNMAHLSDPRAKIIFADSLKELLYLISKSLISLKNE